MKITCRGLEVGQWQSERKPEEVPLKLGPERSRQRTYLPRRWSPSVRRCLFCIDSEKTPGKPPGKRRKCRFFVSFFVWGLRLENMKRMRAICSSKRLLHQIHADTFFARSRWLTLAFLGCWSLGCGDGRDFCKAHLSSFIWTPSMNCSSGLALGRVGHRSSFWPRLSESELHCFFRSLILEIEECMKDIFSHVVRFYTWRTFCIVVFSPVMSVATKVDAQMTPSRPFMDAIKAALVLGVLPMPGALYSQRKLAHVLPNGKQQGHECDCELEAMMQGFCFFFFFCKAERWLMCGLFQVLSYITYIAI